MDCPRRSLTGTLFLEPSSQLPSRPIADCCAAIEESKGLAVAVPLSSITDAASGDSTGEELVGEYAW